MLNTHGDDLYRYDDIRMNFSSNIYSHADMTELKDYLKSKIDVISSYPEPEPYLLEQLIAGQNNISADNVLVTNGATDAIFIIAQALTRAAVKSVAIAQPTFSEYEEACRVAGLRTFDYATHPNHPVLWMCNPNNPTAKVCPLGVMRSLSEKKRLVIVDQSYSEYTDKPLMSPCEAVSRGNVIQIYSLTKTYAIPGLRIGYIVAAAKHIRLLRRYLRTWSVNALAIEAGKWLLTHNVKAVDDIVAYLREAQRLNNMLAQIEGITVFPTETNFMLCRIDVPITAARLKQRLALEHHILIRDASTFTGLDSQYFRVAAQRSDENDALVSAVRRCVRSQ